MRRPSVWHLGLLALCAVALGTGCKDRNKVMQEKVKAREAAKKAFEDAEEARRKAAIPKIEPAHLEPFWDDPAYLKVTTGKPCPEGLWALFPGTPGEGAVKAANEAKREELAAKVRAATFVAVMPFDTGVSLRPWNAKKKQLLVQVDGLVECVDGLGMISLAWGEPAKPFRPKSPDEDEEEVISQQSVWRARPIFFPIPIATKAEASSFIEKQGVAIDARLVFTLGKVAIDKKLIKTAHAYVADGGEPDEDLDWGAGRLVHVDLVGVRIGTDHEKVQLTEKRMKK